MIPQVELTQLPTGTSSSFVVAVTGAAGAGIVESSDDQKHSVFIVDVNNGSTPLDLPPAPISSAAASALSAPSASPVLGLIYTPDVDMYYSYHYYPGVKSIEILADIIKTYIDAIAILLTRNYIFASQEKDSLSILGSAFTLGVFL